MVCTRPPFVGGGRVYKYESDMDCMQRQQRAHITLHDAWRWGLALGLARRRVRAVALPPLPPRAWTYLRSGGMVTSTTVLARVSQTAARRSSPWMFATKMAEAVKWYSKAAEQGHSEAQVNLSSCYEYGVGVEKNGAEAVKWYRKAAELGHG
jgi:TPR repeat protein